MDSGLVVFTRFLVPETLLMAEKSAGKIFLLALQREIDSQRLYDHIASQVVNSVAKAKFEVLKREEAFHEKIVREMYEKSIGALDFTPAETDLPEISGKQREEDSVAVLEFAIEKEREAQAFYRDLASQINDEEGKKVCGKLLEEETSHQHTLEDDLRVLNREFYWYSLEAPPWQVKDQL